MPRTVRRFAGDDRRLQTGIGTRERGRIYIDESSGGTALYGPYVHLRPGAYEATIRFDPAVALRGRAMMDVAAGAGREVLASRTVVAEQVREAGMCASLSFLCPEPTAEVEIRLMCEAPGFAGAIESLEIAGDGAIALTDPSQQVRPPRPGLYIGHDKILTLTDREDKMYLDARDMYITPSVLFYGAWEPETIQTFEEHLRPGMAWADIGANVGYFTIIGHRLVMPGGRTWAFEPNAHAYGLLVDNFDLNWFYTDYYLEQKAVYHRHDRFILTVPEKLSTGATIGTVPHRAWGSHDNAQRHEVEAVSLDEYFANSDRLPDFIKMDIEGAEFFALQGAKAVIAAQSHIKILVEWNLRTAEYCGVEPRQLVELVRELGFSARMAEQDRRVLSDADLLAEQGAPMVLLTRES